MTKKIIFRADGSATTGLGHLYRLFSLVEIVKDTLEFVFLTHETSTGSVIPVTYNKAIMPENISTKNEPEWLAANFSPKEYIIIADGYQFIASYQKNIKQKGYSLIYIDDLAREHMYADVVINHSPDIQKQHYKKEPYTKLALGTKFALLRPLFLNQAKQHRALTTIDSAFVCFGGADPFNLTLKAVKALLNIPDFKKIYVVLGGAYKSNDIFELEREHSITIKTYRNLSEEHLLKVMLQSNFAIAPASTILYELCCVKMPLLSGFYVKNQKYIYKGLAERKVIIKGGNFRNYKISDFEKRIKSVLKNKEIDLFIANQQKLFDGKNKSRFLGLINQLNISFRKANEKDLLQVYNWSNDTLVRKNSYNSNPIKLEDHKIWYLQKIESKKTLFLITLVNNKPAGIVRFEIGKDHSVIGILVSKEFRGQNLAPDILKHSAQIYFDTYSVPIVAYIKKENLVSVKSFENARYAYFKDEIIQGSVSFVYKLEKQDVIG